jgi:hypothetical protein
MDDMDDYPDDGFGPDPFAVAFSDGGFDANADNDIAFDDEDDELPDEFDTVFGGGANSMFNTTAPKSNPSPVVTQSQPTQPKKAQDPFAQKPKATDSSDDFSSFFDF